MSLCRAVAHVGDGTARQVDPADIDSLVADPRALLWLDVQDPGGEDLELLRAEFGFHELALEDAFRRGQRPKVDEYEGYYFIVLYAAAVQAEGEIATHEIHCFWGSNYLVTLHDGPVDQIETAVQRWSTSHERRRQGVAYQAYTLLDAIIDSYFPLVDAISDRIDVIETQVFEAQRSTIREVFALRKTLLDARRVLAPSRDVLNTLIRRDVPVFPPALIPYLVDVHDHAIRAIDTLDLHRDLLAGTMEAHLSATSNRLNQSMLRMTAVTICLMVPTLIAGIYGMNFRNMPELEWEWGYLFALGLIAASTSALVAMFRRIGWL